MGSEKAIIAAVTGGEGFGGGLRAALRCKDGSSVV